MKHTKLDPALKALKARLRNKKDAGSYPDELPLKKFYTPNEIAALFLISKNAVMTLINQGRLQCIVKPPIKGRKIYRLIPLEAVEEFVRNNPDKRWILDRINRKWDGTGYTVYQHIYNHNLKKLKESLANAQESDSPSQETAS